jgi:hypothetical protein
MIATAAIRFDAVCPPRINHVSTGNAGTSTSGAQIAKRFVRSGRLGVVIVGSQSVSASPR